MSGILRGLMITAAVASIALTGCGTKQQETEVKVSVTDSGTGNSTPDTVVNNTTTIVQPAPKDPDTIIQNNTIIERRTDTVVRTIPGASPALPKVDAREQAQIDKWIAANSLNEFGDPQGTVYTGGTPLFDEKTGTSIDRYAYIVLKHPDKPWSSM